MNKTIALFVLTAAPALGAPRTYTVDSLASRVLVHVGRSGVFSFAGHEHEVEASGVEGEVVADPDNVAGSSVSLTFATASLRVTGKGEPAQDVPKVQEIMLGPKVLDAVRFPTVTFRSRRVEGRALGSGAYALQVTGDLTLHGVTRSRTVPLRVDLAGGSLTAGGRTTLRHDEFGMEPVTAGGGTVKVKNEIGLEFHIVARRAEIGASPSHGQNRTRAQ